MTMSKKQLLAVLLGAILTVTATAELIFFLPLKFQQQPLMLDNMQMTIEEETSGSDLAPYAGCLALESNILVADQEITKDDLQPERTAEYYYAVKLLFVAAAVIMLVLALFSGIYSKFNAVPLTRLRYEKLIFFGFLLPIAAGGAIFYFNLTGATDYGIWYNWPGFAVYVTLMTCAVLYITLAMTRKYVNKYCHANHISVPPFQRWPGFLNIGTLIILLATALIAEPQNSSWHYAALIWVIFTAILYLLREIRYIRQLAKYKSYYRYAAGTAYITLCISALGMLLIAVPLWATAEKEAAAKDRKVLNAFIAANSVAAATADTAAK
jgi:hypothetical protein